MGQLTTQMKQHILPVLTKGQHKVDALIAHMQSSGITTWDKRQLPMEHKIVGRFYFRKIFAPKGMLLVGEIHKTESIFNFTKGKALFWNPADGTMTERCEGYSTMCAPAGRKVAIMLEDCVFTSIHPVGSDTTLETVEDELIADSFDDTVMLENYCKYIGVSL